MGATAVAGRTDAGRISVVVCSYRVRDLLERCLASLADADEVIVVDNASGDGTADLVPERFPAAQFIENAANVGFGAAVNRGAAAATGDLLLFLNPDAELRPGSIAAMCAEMDRRPRAAVLGFRQVDGDDVFQLAVGPRPSLPLELARMAVQRRLDRGDRRLAAWLDARLARPRRVPWVSGASLLIRAAAFRAIGGFDESFFLYFEDADLCLRAEAQGEVWYVPTVTVVHHRGRSAEGNALVARRAYRASQRLYWRRYRHGWAAMAIEAYQQTRRLLGGGR